MGYIYMITNKINGNIYVGKTVGTIQARWRDHVSSASMNTDNYYIHQAIRKYGEENFLVEELEKCDNSILSEREIYWIKEKNSFYKDSEKGYNLTRGGDGVVKYSDEEILELWDKGMTQTQISDRLGANINTICQRLTILRPKEARERYTKKRKKKVLQYSLEGIFIREWESETMAEDELGLSKGGVSRACNKERTLCGNFLWKWEQDNITTVRDLMINYAKSRKCSEVDLVNDKGKVVETFSSPIEAEKILGLPRGKVSEVCWHKRPHTCKYKFEWHYPLKKELAYGLIE